MKIKYPKFQFKNMFVGYNNFKTSIRSLMQNHDLNWPKNMLFYYFLPSLTQTIHLSPTEFLNSSNYLIDSNKNGFSFSFQTTPTQQYLKQFKSTSSPPPANELAYSNSNKTQYQISSTFKNQNYSEPQTLRSRTKRPSNDNRNVTSNILRNFFKNIKDLTNYATLIEKIIHSFALAVTKQSFITWSKQNLYVNTSKYVSLYKAKQMFKKSGRSEFCLILRLIFKNYQQNELILQTLTSKKIKNKSVKYHLSGIKDIKRQLFGHKK